MMREKGIQHIKTDEVEMIVDLSYRPLPKFSADPWVMVPGDETERKGPPVQEGEKVLSAEKTSVKAPKLPAAYHHPSLRLRTNAQ